MIDATYAANKGNHYAASGYNLNQANPDVRFQLKQPLNTPVANTYAGQIPGSLGAATIPYERLLMPYPYYSSVNIRNPRYGNYTSHQLQLTVRRRMSSGFLVNFAYTAGKRMSDSNLVPVDFGGAAQPEQVNENAYQDGVYNRQTSKSLDPADVSQRLVTSLLYELPFGQGKRFSPSNRIASDFVSAGC